MVTKGPGVSLLGRRTQIEMLERLLAAVRDGRGGGLVLRGEPGVGKTALLKYAISSASGFRVARAVGIESEMELPFAALEQLSAPSTIERIERLPDPQRDGLRVALGLSSGPVPNQFLVGLAVLTLLSEAAHERPLLCVIDDAQWLDRASSEVLAFVTHRLLAEPIGFLFATRETSGGLSGLPELTIEGLRNGDARALLGSVIKWPLDQRVRDRLIAETRGNPLALLELPQGLTPAQLAGGFGLPSALGLPQQIEESFSRRINALPADSQRLLLVAAAEPVGDPALLWRAATELGIAAAAADAAEAEGLLELAGRVKFRHPLVRSAAYRAAPAAERRAVHRALAEATDRDLDPDRRAWHLAQSVAGFDEEVASELERSAGRAQARGGYAAAAAFIERAAVLTSDPAVHVDRALAAARAKFRAGALDSALELLATAESGPLDEFGRAQIDILRGQISFESSRGSEAPSLLLKAAKRLEPLDSRLSREIYLDALSAALYAGRFAREGSLAEVAQAARAAPPPSRPPRAADLLLDGLSLLVTDGQAVAAPVLQRALRAFRSDEISAEEYLRWGNVACTAAGLMWDYASWDTISALLLRLARDAGDLSALPVILTTRVGMHFFRGEPALALAMADEVSGATKFTGGSIAPYGALALVALQGREAAASELIEAARTELLERGEGAGLSFIHWATAALDNGLGRYEDALAAAQQTDVDSSATWFHNWALVELVEAAARSGKPEPAANALDRLAESTAASGTDWALGIEARSRALTTDGKGAETLYCLSVEALARTPLVVDLARTRLLYGEWLRRERRRLDAREQLRSAQVVFDECGMEAFGERARVELEATGERARKRSPETRDDLTPQEAQISRLVAEGARNQEIAAQLFISPSTVDYHLRKAFRKLGVKSRTELARRVLEGFTRPDSATREN